MFGDRGAQSSRIARLLTLAVGLQVALWLVWGCAPAMASTVPAYGLAQGDRVAAAAGDEIDDDDVGEEEDLEGQVLSRPADPAGIGTWMLRTDDETTATVAADAQTRFDDGVPETGVWVDVDYVVQGDGTWLASRIRPDEYEDSEVVVRLQAGVVPQDIEDAYDIDVTDDRLAQAGIFKFEIDDDTEPEFVKNLMGDPRVLWAELNYVQSVPEEDGYATWGWGGKDPLGYANQWAFDQVDLAAALSRYSGAGVIVAVLDTGVARDHPMLQKRLVAGYDVVTSDADPSEPAQGLARGHGTHVIGVVAKVAPEAKIMPVRVLDGNGRGNTFLVAYAVEWAANHGADVINLSLGTDYDSNVLRDVIDRAIAKGIVVVAAAGNSDSDLIRYPAGYPGVLAVTAVDSQNRKALFANYGDWVDLAAPGVGVTSTVIGPLGLGYASWSGTSMAAPFVAGAAALALDKVPGATSAEIASLLTDNGVRIDGVNLEIYAGRLGRLLAVSPALVDDWRYKIFAPFLHAGRIGSGTWP